MLDVVRYDSEFGQYFQSMVFICCSATSYSQNGDAL